jgi:hypothetical protein
MSTLTKLPVGPKQRSFWYLATPYRSYLSTLFPPGEDALEEARDEAAWLAAQLLDRGVDVFSPIVHSHPIAFYVTSFDGSSDGWLDLQTPYMQAAKGLLIGTFPGWDASRGIAFERRYFEFAEKPIHFVDPDFKSLPVEIQRC